MNQKREFRDSIMCGKSGLKWPNSTFLQICGDLPLFRKYLAVYHYIKTRVLLKFATVTIAELDFLKYKMPL